MVDPTPATLAIGATINGQISQPSQAVRYTFTLAAAAQLYFDTLTDNDQMNWTLTGPGGFSVGRNLRNAESFELGGTNPVMQAGPGVYTLTLTGNGATTGAFSFRLLDLASAVAITSPAPVNASLTPSRSTAFYRFDATAGEAYFLDILARSRPDNYVSLRLIDAYGRQVFGPDNFGNHEWTATLTGRYYLVVEGRVWDTTDTTTYRFTLQAVAPVTIPLNGPGTGAGLLSRPGMVGSALVLTGQESISIPGQAALNPTGDFTLEAWVRPDRFTDTWMPLVWKGDATAGIRSYSLWINNQGYVEFSIMDPNRNDHLDSAPGSIPIAQWTHITAVADHTNSQMRLYLNGALTVTGTLGSPARAGDSGTLLIGSSQETFSGWSRLAGTVDDVRLWSRALGTAEVAAETTAPLTGSETGLTLYLKLDEAQGATTVADSGKLHLTGVVINPFTALPDVILGRIDSPGQTVSYTFSIASAKQVVFDGLTDDDQITVTLTGPDGQVMTRNLRNGDSYEWGGGNPVLSLVPGDYTLTFSANGDHVGTFAARLLDIAGAKPITLGTPVSLQLKPGDSTAAFTFNGSAGDHIFLDRQGAYYGGDLTWRLIDPVGRQVFGPNNYDDAGGITLALTGAYTLLVEGRIYRRDQEIDLDVRCLSDDEHDGCRHGRWTESCRRTGLDDGQDQWRPGPDRRRSGRGSERASFERHRQHHAGGVGQARPLHQHLDADHLQGRG